MTAGPERVSDRAARLVVGKTSAEVAALTGMVRSRTARLRAVREHQTPLALACALDTTLVQTPALALVARRVATAIRTPRSRLMISVGPQQGKTTITSIYGTVWALLDDPDRRIVVASYALELARTNTRKARNVIEQFGTGAVDSATGQPLADRLGIQLARDHHAAADWSLLGVRGGCYAVGATGALTGKPADLLVIDDAHKDREEADSTIMRERVWDWWTNVARTRLAPTASVIIIGTRWHRDDLSGRLLAEQPDVWDHVNVPALSAPGVPDALERLPGVWLESARGHTKADWEAIRRDVGERA